MELKNFFAQDLQGNVIPSPTVYVYLPDTTTLAAGLEDEDGNARTNPFIGTSNGQVTVAAPDGDYDMRVTGAGRDTTMRIRFIDSVAGSADLLRKDLAASSGASLVWYLSAGTGSVPTDVQTTLRDSLSVLRFIDNSLHAAIAAGVYTGDLSTQLNAADAAAVTLGKKLFWPAGVYYCNLTLTGYFNWYGEGNTKSILRPFSSATPVIMDLYQELSWRFTSISQMGLETTAVAPATAGIGFSYGNPTTYGTGMELVGRVIFNQVSFKGFHKGVAKCYGNIGNTYNQCSFQFCDYGHWAVDGKLGSGGLSAQMQPDTDVFNGGDMHENNIACVCVLAASMPVGQLKFNQTVLQFNKGFGVFYDAPSCNGFVPVVFDNVWDEQNGYPGVNVTIDTVNALGTGLTTESLLPVGLLVRGLREKQVWGLSGGKNGINTLNPEASLGIWGDGRMALNLISGAPVSGSNWTFLGFSHEGDEATPGCYIKSTLTGPGTRRDLAIHLQNGTTVPLYFHDNGSLFMGNGSTSYSAPAAGSHVIWGADSTAGAEILTIGARFGVLTKFTQSDGAGANAAASTLTMGMVGARSINAAGTINASGADYAEYEKNNGLQISKGSIVGFKADGTLTLQYSEAVRFGIKSTNPSYVGGDTWGSEDAVGSRPENIARKLDKTERRELTPAVPAAKGRKRKAATYELIIIEAGDTDAQWAEKEAAHKVSVAAFDVRMEAARLLVDRIAYSGKVPVNLMGAIPGGYIIAVDDSGVIAGEFVADPDFAQYKKAVGRVNRILPDGRCEVAVIIH